MNPLLTTRELAKVLNVRESSIYRWASEKKLPVLRVGALVRFDLASVMAAMKGETDDD